MIYWEGYEFIFVFRLHAFIKDAFLLDFYAFLYKLKMISILINIF